mmetsp:Transcript_21424/g.32673  ORF Transcript_21424/g.32673 Transcript_21424/m.32673 type:complete len:130 (+) Transcript_21424:110-499(+)
MLKQCIAVAASLLSAQQAGAFIVGQYRVRAPNRTFKSSALWSKKQVEVCGFKDCKRAGGGPRLEKFIQNVLDERGFSDQFIVEGCDCQGECGYGPNIVLDGKLINGVKGVEAVEKALGIPSATAAEAEN